METASVEIRKTYTIIEEIRGEAGQPADVPLRKVAVVAVFKNPFAGNYQEDLSVLTEASGEIGALVSSMALDAMKPYAVESFGKGGVAGLGGEQQHVSAMLTTLYGNVLRDALGGGKAWISSMTKRAGPGVTIDIPMNHKDALVVRSHYDGMTLTLHDSPHDDEIALICCFANRGQLNHRVGGLAKEDLVGEDGLK